MQRSWRKPRSWGRRGRALALAVVLVVAGAGAGTWLLTRSSGSAAAATTTATVTTETVRTTVALSGTLAPAATADLDFATSGTVTAVVVEPGDRVRRGDVLARLGTDALVATRSAAVATLEAARTQLDEDTDADASDVQLAADETALVAARAALADARQAVADATLRSTMRGTVTEVGVEVGDVVGSSSGAGATGATTGGATTGTTTTTTTSTAAVSVVSTGRFVLDATVAAADVDQLEAGLQVELAVSGVTDTVYGTVSEVGRVAETDSSGAAAFPVVVDVTGSRDDLYAGTSADATVIVEQLPDVLSVSTGAVRTDDDGSTYVEKVDGDRTVRTAIEIGETYGATTEVVSGLEEGDVVEVQGFSGAPGGGQGDRGQMTPPDGAQLPDGFQPPSGGGFPGTAP